MFIFLPLDHTVLVLLISLPLFACVLGVCSEPQPSVGAQREGGGEDYQEPRSQAQLNRAAFDLIELLPSFGAEFSPIFNQHEAETDVGSQSAG
mmetsp:Transcript_40109/g.93922  ORF Transcript_40109/g.93922 Transcript_40109/m.93922 type:complete len:93 (+) Transcript_40109:340-618(+)